MEGQVTLSLKEYTDLVIENNNLKRLVSQYQRRIENEVEEQIYSSRINALSSIEEVKQWLDADDKKLLEKFTSNYSWNWQTISDRNFNVNTAQEVKEIAVVIIKKQLDCQLQDLLEKEKENENL